MVLRAEEPSTLRGRLKRILPRSAWRPASALYWWWRNRGNHLLAGSLSPRRRESARRLRTLRDSHHGERCFILGNGPSLRQTDLRRLKDDVTFGMNRIYLLFGEMGFPTSYYISVNTLVIEQCAEEIRRLTMPRFLTWRGRRALGGDADVIFLDTDYRGAPTFSSDVTGRVFEGSTVTYVALQLAFHLGFAEVILVGVDHRFAAAGPANATVVSAGADPDHFAPDYFGKGFRWQLPDLEASERAYRMALEAYRAAGRTILDATIGGALTVFPKVEYSSLFLRRSP